MKVKFENVNAGWMTVTLLTGLNQYTFDPSDVPCDSILELVDGLGRLLVQDEEVVTHWNDEPIEHVFVFRKTNEQLKLTVFRLSPHSKMPNREVVFSAEDSIYKMIRAFWVALRDLETRYFEQDDDKCWSNPFPKLEMQYLTYHLQNLKKFQV